MTTVSCRTKSALIVAISAVLSACGGGGGSSVASSTPLAEAPSSTTQSQSDTQKTPETKVTDTKTDTKTKSEATPTKADRTQALATKEFIAEAKKGMTKMKRYHEGYNRGAFDGTMLTINNNTGAIKGAPTPNLDFEFFRVNGTRMILLQRLDDKLYSIPLRKLSALDFPDGGYAPKDPTNPGYIGSSYGNSQGKGVDSLKSFGQVRFGVYTDNTNTSHLFVHGNPSARSFSGIFRGSAIIGKDGNYRGLPKAVTAYLNKDFTKLDVAIQTDKTLLKFGADVNYDHKTFNGDNNGVQTYGGLFGTDGLGGFFDVKEGVHKGEHGVFGASNGRDVVEDYKQ